MTYSYAFSPDLDRQLRKLKKKNPALHKRVRKKVIQIIEKPELYKTLKHVGGRYKRVQVGPFVLVFTIEEEMVSFLYLEHHNNAYRKLKG